MIIPNTASDFLPLWSEGLDYEKTPLSLREGFAFTQSQQEAFYHWINSKEEISGAVLLSTCNRLELFLSGDHALLRPSTYICEFLSLNHQDFTEYFVPHQGAEVFHHLSLLSSGVKSQIFGEDQIISQVKRAQTLARDCKATDSILEVMFRLAITCGKKIRSELKLTARDTSMSQQVADLISAKKAQNILIIGNGEMARHVAELLLSLSLDVTMTLRSYRHTPVLLPKNIKTIPYASLFEEIPHLSIDALISATLSPHFTVDYPRFSALKPYPKLLFDLAVPRDIDPEIQSLPQVQLFNVDQLSTAQFPQGRHEILQEVEDIVQKYNNDFYHWWSFRTALEVQP